MKLITGRLLIGVLYASIAVAILATAILAVPAKKAPGSKVILGGKEIVVTIADTPALQEKGLSGRKDLKPNEGMLFIFSRPGAYGFWMKEMLFPIDIIWFNDDRIVDMWENASPDSYPKIYTPHSNATAVLEVQAGFTSEHHLKIGDMLGSVRK